MPTRGYKELSRQLSAMGAAAGGKALRSAAMSATLPALRAAQAAAPRGRPPYQDGDRSFDPYPQRTHKGNIRTPGYASRNVARKSAISRDKTFVRIMIGVKPEAFYAISFQELGTSRIAKQPWLEPSFRNSRPKIDQRLQEQLKKRIDKAARKR